MEEMSVREKDIRRLLKTFGVSADQAIQEYLDRHPEVEQLKLRLELVDLTGSGAARPEPPLHLEVEGEIHR